VETNQIDVVAATVLSDFEQVENAQKTLFSRQGRRDIRETDRLDRVHLNLALLHSITAAHSNVRPRPDPDRARNFSATNSLPEALRKKHQEKERRYWPDFVETTPVTFFVSCAQFVPG
jgi:hypothetical protein